MIIDFGNGEAIRAQHEVGVQRNLEARTLRMQAHQASSLSTGWATRTWQRLLCELDFQRVVLAERLARLGLHSDFLRGDETALFSAGRCG